MTNISPRPPPPADINEHEDKQAEILTWECDVCFTEVLIGCECTECSAPGKQKSNLNSAEREYKNLISRVLTYRKTAKWKNPWKQKIADLIKNIGVCFCQIFSCRCISSEQCCCISNKIPKYLSIDILPQKVRYIVAQGWFKKCILLAIWDRVTNRYFLNGRWQTARHSVINARKHICSIEKIKTKITAQEFERDWTYFWKIRCGNTLWSCQRNLLRLKCRADVIRVYHKYKNKPFCADLDTGTERVKVDNVWYSASTAAKAARKILAKKYKFSLPQSMTIAGLQKWKRCDNGVPVSDWIQHCDAVVRRDMSLQTDNFSKEIRLSMVKRGKRIFLFLDSCIENICGILLYERLDMKEAFIQRLQLNPEDDNKAKLRSISENMH